MPSRHGQTARPAPDLHAIVATRLRRDGQRYTDNRRALVGVLGDAGQPLTIAEILRRGDDLAQSSAYRNLAVLERAGVVQRLLTTDEWARYELAEDLTGHHHHLICSACGAVADVAGSAELERSLARAIERVAGDSGYRIERHRLDLLGVCPACSRAGRSGGVVGGPG
ncbi:MAG: transcriptional repressor [Acidimicrobiales bacterium]|nr:transcriptional repressor [Acidimicrobiales bacterium]